MKLMIVLDLIQSNPDQQIAVLVRSRSHLKHIVPKLKAAGVEFESLKNYATQRRIIYQRFINTYPRFTAFGR